MNRGGTNSGTATATKQRTHQRPPHYGGTICWADIAPIAQTLGPVITAVTFILAYRFGVRRLRLNARHTFQTMLLDSNKMLIGTPGLAEAHFDVGSSDERTTSKQVVSAQLRSFVYMKFNMFDTIFAYYEDERNSSLFGLSTSEERAYEVWRSYFQDFLERSRCARDIVNTELKSSKVYGEGFMTIVNQLMRKIESAQGKSPTQ